MRKNFSDNFILFILRFGVVGNNSKMVKDCYILPLASSDAIHKCLLPLDGVGLDSVRPNMLMALIVRTRRKRPGDPQRKPTAQPASHPLPSHHWRVAKEEKKSSRSPLNLTDDDIKDLVEMSADRKFAEFYGVCQKNICQFLISSNCSLEIFFKL